MICRQLNSSLSLASRTVIFPADTCSITNNRRASFVFINTSPLFIMMDIIHVLFRNDNTTG